MPTPGSSDTFQVVGECYIHGLSDAVGLLGPVPYPWQPIIIGDAVGCARQWFFNRITGDRILDDPRLTPLPYHGWDRAVYERTDQDPVMFERFVHAETGETQNHDPRKTPEDLERGVSLKTLWLV